MYCQSCGTEHSADASYCQSCGADLATNAESSKPTTDQVETQGQPTTDQVEAQGQPTTDQVEAQGQPAAGQQATPVNTGWTLTRKAAVGGGLLAAVSLFLPWATAVRGGFSASGLDTEIGSIVMVAVAVALLPPLLAWGGGLGWLSMLVSGLGGGGVGYLAVVTQSLISRTVSFGTMTIKGQDVPVAALDPGTGILVAIAGGGLVILAAIGGILGTITRA